jgi:hypothetical protein
MPLNEDHLKVAQKHRGREAIIKVLVAPHWRNPDLNPDLDKSAKAASIVQ